MFGLKSQAEKKAEKKAEIEATETAHSEALLKLEAAKANHGEDSAEARAAFEEACALAYRLDVLEGWTRFLPLIPLFALLAVIAVADKVLGFGDDEIDSTVTNSPVSLVKADQDDDPAWMGESFAWEPGDLDAAPKTDIRK